MQETCPNNLRFQIYLCWILCLIFWSLDIWLRVISCKQLLLICMFATSKKGIVVVFPPLNILASSHAVRRYNKWREREEKRRRVKRDERDRDRASLSD